MPKMSYTHLTQHERYQICALRGLGRTVTQIALTLNRPCSTISRELKRGVPEYARGTQHYRADTAHKLAQERAKQCHGARLGEKVWRYVAEKLQATWSPEQISAVGDGEGIAVSHASIYKYIDADAKAGGQLFRHLRCQKMRRKQYGSGKNRRGTIANQVSIDLRPDVVAKRERFGDFEVDLVIGANHHQALVTINERLSRYTMMAKVATKQTQGVTEKIIELLRPVHAYVHTLTSDNGTEFTNHQRVAAALNLDYYFAHPYCSWERGANENMNGLIRQFFPKKMRFESITEHDTARACYLMNHRPRKCLGYRTPHEVFYAHIAALASNKSLDLPDPPAPS